jgi:GNAT superfamily N-acetyltransferase
MHIGFDHADLGELTRVWNNFYPAKFRIDEAMFRQNTVESPVFDWGASSVYRLGEAVLGFAAIKRASSPTLFKGDDPDKSHLSAIAFTEAEVGVDLLAYAKGVIRDRGSDKLVFGQDVSHFFPGCPVECTSLRDFLTVEGFEEKGEVLDVENDLATYEGKPGCLERLTGDVTVRPVAMAEKHVLEQFLSKEFPGRWTYDVMKKVEIEGRTDNVYALFVGDDMEGFAFTQDWTHKKPINGCVWHLDLGDRWGGLGPIGMAASMRGKGLGDSLLAGALMGLKKKGVRRMIIDWTGLVRYYGGHGFTVNRRYNGFELGFEG